MPALCCIYMDQKFHSTVIDTCVFWSDFRSTIANFSRDDLPLAGEGIPKRKRHRLLRTVQPASPAATSFQDRSAALRTALRFRLFYGKCLETPAL